MGIAHLPGRSWQPTPWEPAPWKPAPWKPAGDVFLVADILCSKATLDPRFLKQDYNCVYSRQEGECDEEHGGRVSEESYAKEQ
jgi:hypothetical protein